MSEGQEDGYEMNGTNRNLRRGRKRSDPQISDIRYRAGYETVAFRKYGGAFFCARKILAVTFQGSAGSIAAGGCLGETCMVLLV